MKFSVLIANYNNGKYLEECLQSIFTQTYRDWEIVIVDDASTDNSSNIYAKYANQAHIKIIKNNKNKGCGFSKRKCVEHATGDICGFVDADDALIPDALEIMVKQHIENPEHSLIYSTHYVCDDKLNPQRIAEYVGPIPRRKKSYMILFPVISHFATFKRAKYIQTEGISEIYFVAEDKDLYFKLEDVGPVLFINQPTYFYRTHTTNVSLNERAYKAYQYELSVRALTLLRHGKTKEQVKAMASSTDQLVNGVITVVVYEMRKKHFFIAMKFFYKALLFSPFIVIKVALKKIKEKGKTLLKT